MPGEPSAERPILLNQWSGSCGFFRRNAPASRGSLKIGNACKPRGQSVRVSANELLQRLTRQRLLHRRLSPLPFRALKCDSSAQGSRPDNMHCSRNVSLLDRATPRPATGALVRAGAARLRSLRVDATTETDRPSSNLLVR